LKAIIWPYAPAAQRATHTAIVPAIPCFIGSPFQEYRENEPYNDAKIYETRHGKLLKKIFIVFSAQTGNCHYI
jgi:hypothetical protein